MNLRVLAAVAGALGGACWVARWGADLAGDAPGWADGAYWAGLGLLGVAFAGVGAGLVSRSASWLRVIVAVAFPLLVWSVYSVVNGVGDDLRLDGILGVVAILGSVAIVIRDRDGRPVAHHQQPPRSHGSHSAR
jgi:hypothetical protein